MTRQWTKRIGILASLVAVIALVGACGSSEDPTATPRPAATAAPQATATPAPTAMPKSAAKFGGIYRVAIRGDLAQKLDPMVRNFIHNAVVQAPLYGNANLLTQCRDNQSDRTCLYQAESWNVSADFKVWTFRVRDDILWHDGTPFTAEDVRFWMDLWVNGSGERRPGRNAQNFGDVSSVEALSGNVVRLTLNSPGANLPVTMARPGQYNGHPKHLVKPELDKGNTAVGPEDYGYVGAGPFKWETYEKGSVISVRRFDKYFEKDEDGRQLPYLDGIDWPIITDREQQVAAFRTGRLDATGRGGRANWAPAQMETVRKSSLGDEVIFGPVQYSGLSFSWDLTDPNNKWQDIRLRKALALALDRSAGVSLWGDESQPEALYKPAGPFTNPDYLEWPGYDPATKEQDRAEARRLLAEAGFPDGFEAKLLCRDSSIWSDVCEIGAEQYRTHLGINFDIEIVDNVTLTKASCDGGYDMIIRGGPSFTFPDTAGANLYTVDKNPCANLKHNDTRLDDFIDQIRASTDHEERVRLTREMERYVLKEQSYIVATWSLPLTFAYRTYVKGIILTENDAEAYLDHAWVWLDK